MPISFLRNFFFIILHPSKKGRCRLILNQQTDAIVTSIFDWEVRRLGMRDALKHGTITVSGFGYFHKNCRFLWGKQCFKDKFWKYKTL